MKTITVTIKQDGSAVVETAGFRGKACKTATAQLEAALGEKKTDVNTAEHDLREDERTTVSR